MAQGEETLFAPYLHHDDKETGERSRGPAVFALQMLLLGLCAGGYFDDLDTSDAPEEPLVPSGVYCDTTLYWTARLQEKLGFPKVATAETCGQDGHFGPKTRGQLLKQLGIDVNGILRSVVTTPARYSDSDDVMRDWPPIDPPIAA